MRIYTTTVHPIGEDNDCTATFVGKTEDEAKNAALARMREWDNNNLLEWDSAWVQEQYWTSTQEHEL